MSDTIRERFLIVRQLDIGPGWSDNVTYGKSDGVPGRVLDLVRNELFVHLPDLDMDLSDEIAKNIVSRLYRAEKFDMDKAMEADEYWRRGTYK